MGSWRYILQYIMVGLGSKEKIWPADKSNYYQVDVSLLSFEGKSATEIAAKSSMHKSCGFGINSVRGSQIEYLERLDKAKIKVLLISLMKSAWIGNSTALSSTLNAVIDSCLMHFWLFEAWTIHSNFTKIEEELSLLPESTFKEFKVGRD